MSPPQKKKSHGERLRKMSDIGSGLCEGIDTHTQDARCVVGSGIGRGGKPHHASLHSHRGSTEHRSKHLRLALTAAAQSLGDGECPQFVAGTIHFVVLKKPQL